MPERKFHSQFGKKIENIILLNFKIDKFNPMTQY